MRSFISDKAREIISDPKKNKELRDAIARLSETSPDSERSVIDNRTYNIRFVNKNSKNK